MYPISCYKLLIDFRFLKEVTHSNVCVIWTALSACGYNLSLERIVESPKEETQIKKYDDVSRFLTTRITTIHKSEALKYLGKITNNKYCRVSKHNKKNIDL